MRVSGKAGANRKRKQVSIIFHVDESKILDSVEHQITDLRGVSKEACFLDFDEVWYSGWLRIV